ncbi:MAG: hypothetical protein OXG53_10770 [Chloroflexi bacterium]|nr:hypothetical protein [Chloroflexota bacterium]
MKLEEYFKKIENVSFQIQFSVLSGLSSVEFALSRDKTVSDLLTLLRQEKHFAEHVYHRIRYLLPRVSQEANLSYDESIVAYLYCLNKTDLLFAHRASTLIWDAAGLLWSRWLAFKIIQLVRQIEQSLDVSSFDSATGAHSIGEEEEYVDTRSLAEKSVVSLVAKPDMIGSYAFELSTAASEEM